ncbi:MAG: pyridoxal phosphate-dependent aminotransferase [Microcystaceae cyanobacterium]
MKNPSRMNIVQSPIIPIVGQLIRENEGTISLGQGVVFYPPPSQIQEGLSQFLANPKHHLYQGVQGIPELQELIIKKLQTDNNISLSSQQDIMVTAGGNMAFMNALLAITSAGDEIILNLPYYFNHEMGIMMADCKPVYVPTDSNYQLQLDLLEAAITPKTRAIVTISPNNPTGVVYPESSLRAVNQLCKERGIYYIHDEAYDYFTYQKDSYFSPGAIPDSEQHTILLYSLSKAYGMASWRIGYLVFPKHLKEALAKIQDTFLICPPVISQYAALQCLNLGKSYCQPYLKQINEVRQIVLEKLNALQDFCTLIPTQGAFYVFLKINQPIDDFTLVKYLIEHHKVAVLPGNTFGLKDGCYLRIAFGALQKETVSEGIDRLVTGITAFISKQ